MTNQELCNQLNISEAELTVYLTHGIVPATTSGAGKYEFSEEEADLLGRAALLSLLGFSIEDILDMRDGRSDMNERLAERRDILIADVNDDNKAAMVCQNIRREKKDYFTFDVQDHLAHVRELEGRGGHFYHPYGSAPVFDSVPQAFPEYERPRLDTSASAEYVAAAKEEFALRYSFPWKRFFARSLDDTIYMTIVLALIEFVFRINATSNYFLYIGIFYATYAAEMLLEPLILSGFGTTIGKLIMGVRVTNKEGGRLTVKEAYRRTFLLYRHGLGFLIPFYNLVCEMKCLSISRRGETLPWDADYAIKLKDRKFWRMLVLFFTVMLLSSISTDLNYAARMPVNRGSITREQFFENVESVSSFLSDNLETAPYQVTCDSQGYVTAVTLNYSSNAQQIRDTYTDMYIAILAFVGADPSVKSYNLFTTTKLDPILDSFTPYSIEYKGYLIENQVEYEGYNKMALSNPLSSFPDYYLYSDGSENRSYSQSIKISKIAK